jgi:hypothetical protein
MDQLPADKRDSRVRPDRYAAAIEQWLRDEVIPGHQEYPADPSQGVPAADILVRIKARRTAR